jgi:hypothetical protein
MRQQVRLNVLIPVAVLGLLGAGFGAWAMGSSPEPAALPAPATTTAAAPTTPAPPAAPKPGTVTVDAWSAGANAMCQKTDVESPASGKPAGRKELLASLASARDMLKTYSTGLAALGTPQGHRAQAAQAQALNARAATAFRQAHAALKRGDAERARRILEAADSGLGDPVRIYRRLGAELCGDDAATYLELARATDSLSWLLLRYRTVVVVFYAPRSAVDSKAVLEARSAAVDAGAGFAAVNVKREKEVADLAVGYQVLDTPSVLVFSRGPRLRSHFTGIVDRETVEQAVVNAGR